MKRILLISFLLVVSLPGWAQGVTMTYKFGVKGSVKNPYEKIEEYVVGILGFEKVEGASNTYTGNIPALATYRKGDRKMLYSGDVTVKFTYDGYTVTGVFSYPYIIETVTICDNNQTVIENHLQKADMTKAVFKQVDHYTEDHMDQIRNYVNRQNRDLPSTPDLTTFMKMQYTVEDEQVSYYSIIPSKNNLTAAQLYAIAERWYTYSYRSGKAVIEVRDKDNYIITGKGIYERIFDDDGHKVDFPHIFSIQCRDGRVRAVVSIGLIDWRDEDGDFHRVKIVDYQPFGDDKEKWSMKSIEEAEKIIAEQFAELQKAFDEGLNAVENKDDW